MIPVSYRERLPLLAFGWVCHAFASIYMYSRHTITRAYHAYLITMRSDVSHGGYQSFSVRWYLYYPFYISYVWFYFLPYIPVHFHSYWCPIAWGHCIFVSCVQVQVGTLIDPSARISGFSCELVSSTSSWSFHGMVTFVYSLGIVGALFRQFLWHS